MVERWERQKLAGSGIIYRAESGGQVSIFFYCKRKKVVQTALIAALFLAFWPSSWRIHACMTGFIPKMCIIGDGHT